MTLIFTHGSAAYAGACGDFFTQLAHSLVPSSREYKEAIQELRRLGRTQELVWALREGGRMRDAAKLEAALVENLKKSSPRTWETAEQGHTGAIIATLPDGTRGVFKPYGALYPDQWRMAEVAAYEVDRLFGFNVVPATVDRRMFDKWGSFQYVVADARDGFQAGIYHRTKASPSIATLDFLINNRDPVGMNLLVTKDGKRIAIDHDFAFEKMEVSYQDELKLKSQLYDTVNREVIAKLKSVKDSEIRSRLFHVLSSDRIEALIARKNMLLKVAKEGY